MSNTISRSDGTSRDSVLQRFHDGPCCRRCVDKGLWPWVDTRHAACCCASQHVGRHDEVVCEVCGFLREILGEPVQVRLIRVRAHAASHAPNAEWDLREPQDRIGQAIASAILEQDEAIAQQAVAERSRKRMAVSHERRYPVTQRDKTPSLSRSRRVVRAYVGCDGFIRFKYEGED